MWCGYVVDPDPGPSAEEVGHVLLQVSVLFDEATPIPCTDLIKYLEAMVIMA